MTTATSTSGQCQCVRGVTTPETCIDRLRNTGKHIDRDDDDGLEMHDNSCDECGHPYKPGDETHYPECSRLAT